MKLPLSKRLTLCADMVGTARRVADIGCDHGYLSIHLLKNCGVQSVIASDINEQPLQSAVRNAMKFGVRNKIEFFISDGVRNIPRDFDCLVCAGMGADTMISILEAAPWLKNENYRMILQCQSKTSMLRQYLSEQGWRIRREAVVRDGRFLYTVMEILWQPEHPLLTAGECYVSPALLENNTPETAEYYRWVIEGIKIAVRYRNEPEMEQALAQLEALADRDDLKWLKEVHHDNCQ